MKHQNLDHFFSRSARFTIFIPIGIIIIALGIRAYELAFTKTNPSKPEVEQIVVEPNPTPKPQIDLQGPAVCAYSSKTSTAKAYIKNRNIFIENKKTTETDYFLLKGDCLHIWEKSATVGERVCGLNTYLSLFETFSQFNFLGDALSADALSSIVSSIGSQSGESLKSLDLEKALNSCKKQDFKDTGFFTVPTTVAFQNISLEDLMKEQTATPSVSP